MPQIEEAELDFSEVEKATADIVCRVGEERLFGRTGLGLGHPGRNFRLRLEAAYLHDIRGHPIVLTTSDRDRWEFGIRDYLGLRGEEVVSRDKSGEKPDRLRHRGTERVVRRGGYDWKRLGAWPWAAFDGPLPHDWRADPRTALAIERWHAEGVRRSIRRNLRSSAQLRRARAVGRR